MTLNAGSGSRPRAKSTTSLNRCATSSSFLACMAFSPRAVEFQGAFDAVIMRLALQGSCTFSHYARAHAGARCPTLISQVRLELTDEPL